MKKRILWNLIQGKTKTSKLLLSDVIALVVPDVPLTLSLVSLEMRNGQDNFENRVILENKFLSDVLLLSEISENDAINAFLNVGTLQELFENKKVQHQNNSYDIIKYDNELMLAKLEELREWQREQTQEIE